MVDDELGKLTALRESPVRRVVDDTTALAARVAGAVFANPYHPWRPPLFAGELANGPLWDYPFVKF